jgi:hypothetical protein
MRAPLSLALLLLSIVALVTGPGLAAAAKPEVFVNHIDETFPDDPTTNLDDLCGIPVTTHVDAVEVFQVRVGENGFPRFKGTFNGTITWTNEATGFSIQQRVANAFRVISVTDNGDGTITVESATTGLPEKLIASDGTVLSVDVGRIVFRDVFDYNGTPLDANDDVFISGEIISIRGPHPNAESDFALFCEIVTGQLT